MRGINALIRLSALSLLVSGIGFCACCQTIIMPAHGSGDTTMSYAVVYDDGGPTGAYSSSCYATYTFHTVSPSSRYRIDVESQLTNSQGAASLVLHNGTSTGSNICSFPSGSGGRFVSSGNTVTIVFRADDDYPTQGFKVVLCEFNQADPSNFRHDYIDSSTLKIEWDEPSSDVVWVLDYAVVPNDANTVGYFDNPSNPWFTLQLTQPEYTIYNIPSGHKVIWRLISLGASGCSSPQEGTVPPYQPPPLCPCAKPLIVSVESLQDSVRITWTVDPSGGATEVSLWHVFSVDNSVDTFLAGDVMELTIPYDFPCRPGLFFINGNCRDSTCNSQWVELPRGGCHRTVGSLRRQYTNGHSITLSWDATDNPADRYLLLLRRGNEPEDSNRVVDTIDHNVTMFTVDGLQPHAAYRFTMVVLCDGTTPACSHVEALISTTIDGCIDFINFDDPCIHMTSGTYDNPSSSITTGDERHRAIVDSSLRDPLTGGLLRQVPPGDEVSFRLGDENGGALGETVTFDYIVDTLDKDMLLVKYAVVLQNPDHSSSNQPHFMLEILDRTGHVVDTQCFYADFYAAGDLGWNTVSGSNVIWKDWTNVGIDISAYHGQLLRIRFTTKDCADGGHFGYAYFTIACDNRRIALVNLCDSRDSVLLRAPEGFEYRWQRVGDTTVIATASEILVPADSSEYVCHCTFLGKAVCGFSVYATAMLPRPLAAIGFRIDTCGQAVYLYNRCRVDIDSAYLHLVRQTIVDAEWTVGGRTMTGDTIVVPIVANGNGEVSIRCRLSDSQCADSASLSYSIDCFHRHQITGPSDACRGDSVTVSVSLNPVDHYHYHWGDGSTATSQTFVPDGDTTVSLVATWYAGASAAGSTHCTDTLVHAIVLHPTFDDTVALLLCQGVYDTLGFSINRETESGLYSNRGVSSYGCDSVFSIDLAVNPSYYDTTRAVTCNESYSDGEFDQDSTGVYTHVYQTEAGCDSVYVLDFLRSIPAVETFEAEIVRGDIYTDHGFRAAGEGWFVNAFTDRYGCDSIVYLNLHVVALRFPNVVTPNGDGVNDLWGITGLLDAREFEYSVYWVYDRWGRLIIRRENIHEEDRFWDPDKTHTPEGTYFFRFYARHGTGREIEHKGVIEVVR